LKGDRKKNVLLSRVRVRKLQKIIVFSLIIAVRVLFEQRKDVPRTFSMIRVQLKQ